MLRKVQVLRDISFVPLAIAAHDLAGLFRSPTHTALNLPSSPVDPDPICTSCHAIHYQSRPPALLLGHLSALRLPHRFYVKSVCRRAVVRRDSTGSDIYGDCCLNHSPQNRRRGTRDPQFPIRPDARTDIHETEPHMLIISPNSRGCRYLGGVVRWK